MMITVNGSFSWLIFRIATHFPGEFMCSFRMDDDDNGGSADDGQSFVYVHIILIVVEIINMRYVDAVGWAQL